MPWLRNRQRAKKPHSCVKWINPVSICEIV